MLLFYVIYGQNVRVNMHPTPSPHTLLFLINIGTFCRMLWLTSILSSKDILNYEMTSNLCKAFFNVHLHFRCSPFSPPPLIVWIDNCTHFLLFVLPGCHGHVWPSFAPRLLFLFLLRVLALYQQKKTVKLHFLVPLKIYKPILRACSLRVHVICYSCAVCAIYIFFSGLSWPQSGFQLFAFLSRHWMPLSQPCFKVITHSIKQNVNYMKTQK